MNKLIVFMGLSGAGKSTLIKELATPDTDVHASDTLRGEMLGDENNQENHSLIFAEMYRRTVASLRDGRDVIYDATNLSSKRRRHLVHSIMHDVPGVETELHIVLETPEQCIANQSLRERQVPADVIMGMAYRFQVPKMDEGWTNPIYVHNRNRNPALLDELCTQVSGVSQLSQWHQETVGQHHEMAARYAQEAGFPDLVQDVARYHDIGKLYAYSVGEDGETHFYNHQYIGAYLYLCAQAPTGVLSPDVHQRALLMEHHMDLLRPGNDAKLKRQVGEQMFSMIQQHAAADVNGAITRAQAHNMSVLEFMNTFPDWEERIQQPPYCVTIKHDGDLVLLKYQQLNSDMSIRLVQESRGSIFTKGPNGWQYVCRPFDKFFNHGQQEAAEIDWSTARVTEKVDGCFSGEDAVLLADGSSMKMRTLRTQVKKGEKIYVLSYNFSRKKVEARRVMAVKRTRCRDITEWLTVYYTFGNLERVMTVTRNHGIFVKNGRGWKETPAEFLKPGNILATNKDRTLMEGVVTKILPGMQVHRYKGHEDMYKFDIEVFGNHNYFCQGALVHNSLMKIYHHDGSWRLATNGNIDAFKAPVADLGISFGDLFNRALGMPYESLANLLEPGKTYMFELTSPDAQLVVSYPDSVYYLSCRDNQTGIETTEPIALPGVQYPAVYPLTTIQSCLDAVSKMSSQEEGFVVSDAQGNRVKIKSPEYLMAAKLANNKMVSNRNLVIYLQNDQLDDFLGYCPQFQSRVDVILEHFRAVCHSCEDEWQQYRAYSTLSRKEFAASIAGAKNTDYLFYKYSHPDVSAEEFLKRQLTPALMRRMGVDNPNPIQFSREEELCV